MMYARSVIFSILLISILVQLKSSTADAQSTSKPTGWINNVSNAAKKTAEAAKNLGKKAVASVKSQFRKGSTTTKASILKNNGTKPQAVSPAPRNFNSNATANGINFKAASSSPIQIGNGTLNARAMYGKIAVSTPSTLNFPIIGGNNGSSIVNTSVVGKIVNGTMNNFGNSTATAFKSFAG